MRPLPTSPPLDILIVEDYPVVARALEREVRAILTDRVSSLTAVTNVIEAQRYLESHAIDLLLLDLNLGGADGFDLLRWAAAGGFHTIAVSANTQRAIQAYEYGVLDFVPKPVEPHRLRLAIERLNDSGQARAPESRFLSVRRRDGYERVTLSDVRYLQGAGKYTTIHLHDGRELLHDKTLERLTTTLPADFMRIHKSYTANLLRAQRLIVQGGGSYELQLEDGTRLPVGRTRYKDVRKRLGE